MDKLKMAHEYAMELVASPDFTDKMSIAEFVGHCWKYADLMQAEADEREPKGFPDVLCEADAFADPFKGMHPPIDWNKYGKGLYHFWAMDGNGQAFWHNREPRINEGKWDSCHKYKAPSFNYQGDWRESLRKRP